MNLQSQLLWEAGANTILYKKHSQLALSVDIFEFSLFFPT